MSDWRETARRLAAHPRWLEAALSGRLVGVRMLVPRVDAEGDGDAWAWRMLRADEEPGHVGWEKRPVVLSGRSIIPEYDPAPEDSYPDLTDAATAGVLLGLLLAEWPHVILSYDEGTVLGDGWYVHVYEGLDVLAEHAAEAVAIALLKLWEEET